MSFIGNSSNTPQTNKGVQITGLWEQYKRDAGGNKTDEVSHLSGKVGTDADGSSKTFTVATGDSLKVWPNGFKDQQGQNAPSYIVRLYKADGTVQEIPVESGQ
jgi:hypothetical protein|tara:strand:+ start:194 stop:502 length:309 start_codon:yes stop_codon:yes gene_type:complete